MKRRTNLFYTNSDEVNFLSFSNYSEHLTGVSLATNYKLFPSRFICMHIPKLDLYSEDINARFEDFDTNIYEDPETYEQSHIKTREEIALDYRVEFINEYLVAYYENKLAFLRDIIVNSKDPENIEISHPDQRLLYLGYLMDAILDFDPESTIELISDITEQDYNGTFTDIICTIDSAKAFDTLYEIEEGERFDANPDGYRYTINESPEALYGWMLNDIWQGPSNFNQIKPKYDLDNYYYIKAKHISINKVRPNDENDKKTEMSFNIIIPLYDIVLNDPFTNNTLIKYNSDKDDVIIDMEETPLTGDVVKNVPYGIWFANDVITLKKDNYTKYAPSWSLLISTQFKPFPNSEYLYTDINDGLDMKAAFATYAQVLSRQNALYDKWEENLTTLRNTEQLLNSKIEELNKLKEEINKFDEDHINELINKALDKFKAEQHIPHVWVANKNS